MRLAACIIVPCPWIYFLGAGFFLFGEAPSHLPVELPLGLLICFI